MTIWFIVVLICAFFWLLVLGCGEIEHREERWRRAHPPDEKGGGRE